MGRSDCAPCLFCMAQFYCRQKKLGYINGERVYRKEKVKR